MSTLIHNHTQTSIAAANSIQPSTQAQRSMILLAILYAGVNGLTRQELERTGIRPDSIRPRVKELMDAGAIEESGEVRETSSGRPAKVLVVKVKQ